MGDLVEGKRLRKIEEMSQKKKARRKRLEEREVTKG
jgi:hypothetical protein